MRRRPARGDTNLPAASVMRLAALCLLLLLLLPTACSAPPPLAAESGPIEVTLHVDGDSHNLTTRATNVRELLAEAGITTAPADEVTPPPFTPLQEGMEVVVVRVEELVEVIEESLPFARKIVRSAAMGAGDPPQIIQGGRAGLQEITVRIVIRNGVEVDRQRTRITMVEEPQDEIVMVGVGATASDYTFPGLIAFLSGGQGVLLRGTTSYHEPLATGATLDGRVFALSPSGSHLLYTSVVSDTGRFHNKLFVISTEPGASARDLNVENVLWAGWNPAADEEPQIAYSTAEPVDVPPGWQANNDIWTGDLPAGDSAPFNPRRVVETYPATYGWWGGNYAWSPDGRYLAFGFADEVGLYDLETRDEEERAVILHTFTEYDTRADWVWLPGLSWSPDSRFLTFSSHGSSDPEAMSFDIWVVNANGGLSGRFVEQAGMWSHPHWSPADSSRQAGRGGSQIAFLQANNPLDGLRSPYSLWVMDADGSNTHRAYPPAGENTAFPQDSQFMSWGPSGRDIAFIFHQSLYLFNVDSGVAFRVTQDDAPASRPTWAPYGAGISGADSERRLAPAASGSTTVPRTQRPDEE
jgi:resuscitation-promoting factor RpfB